MPWSDEEWGREPRTRTFGCSFRSVARSRSQPAINHQGLRTRAVPIAVTQQQVGRVFQDASLSGDFVHEPHKEMSLRVGLREPLRSPSLLLDDGVETVLGMSGSSSAPLSALLRVGVFIASVVCRERILDRTGPRRAMEAYGGSLHPSSTPDVLDIVAAAAPHAESQGRWRGGES